jgi:hypothetical protein
VIDGGKDMPICSRNVQSMLTLVIFDIFQEHWARCNDASNAWMSKVESSLINAVRVHGV